MKGSVASVDVMLAHQGDRVLLLKPGKPDRAFTLVHVVDTTGHQFRLVNRDDKTRKPDWALSQLIWDAMSPARPNKLDCKWEVTVR